MVNHSEEEDGQKNKMSTVMAHEVGHVLDLHHPDIADIVGKKYGKPPLWADYEELIMHKSYNAEEDGCLFWYKERGVANKKAKKIFNERE